MEYEIDFTKEGYENQNSQGHNYYGKSYQQNSDYSYGSKETKGQSSLIENIILFAVVAGVIYALYRTCLAPATEQAFQSRYSVIQLN